LGQAPWAEDPDGEFHSAERDDADLLREAIDGAVGE
jgi:hypothetical protein